MVATSTSPIFPASNEGLEIPLSPSALNAPIMPQTVPVSPIIG